ncbi:MAG: glycerate kinase [Candidatus Eremiobacteraeota bacterium]|nr:glycerate kinase [Candidatus Eremiobacteraeota bacterium]
MRILIATDKFKGSLSAIHAACAMRDGFARAFPDAQIDLLPVADGGDGTMDALLSALGGKLEFRRVTGPAGTSVEASFGLLGAGVAVVELAKGSGMALLGNRRNDPATATTFGTGELIAAAVDAGARRIILAVGGSATNDAGAGALSALGAQFLDPTGARLPHGGVALARLAHIDISGLRRRLEGVTLDVACDVDNPLCGPDGASAVYGPQKGAAPETVRELDAALERFALVAAQTTGVDVRSVPGAGAAGGTAGGFLALAGARLRAGAELVLEVLRFNERIGGVDLVVTGEGCLDAQSLRGKAPFGVTRAAAAAGIPAVAIAGSIPADNAQLSALGLATAATIATGPMSLEQSTAGAAVLLSGAAERLGRAIALKI